MKDKDDYRIDESYCEIVVGLKNGGSKVMGSFPVSYKEVVGIMKNQWKYKALLDSAKYTVHRYRKPSYKTDQDCPICIKSPVENCIHIHLLEKCIDQIEEK